jgi:hypothetical protein
MARIGKFEDVQKEKKVKRLLVLVSCAVLVTSPVTLAHIGPTKPGELSEFKQATEPSTPQERAEFSDVPQTHWAHSTVKRLAEIGIMQGNSNGQFQGDVPLKRADFAIVLNRLNSRRTSPLLIPEWAKEQKSYFTRYEFAVGLSRVFHVVNPTQPPFSGSEPPNAPSEFRDIPQTHWARPAANHLAGIGLIEGQGHLQGEFNGNALLTRYEFAVALIRSGL